MEAAIGGDHDAKSERNKDRKDVTVLIGAVQIGQAIARRVGVAKHILLGDMRPENANGAAEVLGNVGYVVRVATVDASPERQFTHLSIGPCRSATGQVLFCV